MNKYFNYIDIFLIIIFMLPVISGFIRNYDSYSIKYGINKFEKNVLLIITGLICLYWSDKGVVIYEVMSIFSRNKAIKSFADNFPKLYFFFIFIIVFSALYYILKSIVYMVNRVLIYPLIDNLGDYSKEKGVLFKSTLGALFAIPRSIINVILVCALLSVLPSEFNIFNIDKSTIYNRVNNKVVDPIKHTSIVSQLPKILNNSLNIKVVDNDVVKSVNVDDNVIKNQGNNSNGRKVIVYYNGVTLDEGIKSNKSINNTASKITSGKNNSRDKALAIYKWIGSNITYDDNKAEQVLAGVTTKESGAIPAYNKRKGICFDYACLYVAMCRSQGLKVRIITGLGYNGRQWVNHAWNQVYIEESKRWVNVDPTFSVAGNYFDNSNFFRDHKESQIAGQW